MAPLDKIIERLLRRPPEADFDDVRAVLEGSGWTFARESSSHCSFTKPGERTMVIPKVSGGKVKGTYVKQLIKLLDLDKESDR